MNKKKIQGFLSQYKVLALLTAIAVIWIFFGWLTEGDFLTPRNFSNLLRQMAITGMLASTMVLVIVLTEIDLSVGYMSGLLGGIAAILDVNYHLSLAANVSVILVLGVMIGLVTGYITAYMRIPSFIATLGLMLVYRGGVLGLTKGITVGPVSKDMVVIGQGYLPETLGNLLGVVLFALFCFIAYRTRQNRKFHKLAIPAMWQEIGKLVLCGAAILAFVVVLDSYEGIPVPVLILLFIVGAFTILSNKTVFGRHIYAIGSNIEATRLSGVNTERVRLIVFGLMGLMCAFAGLTTTARLAAGSPSAGQDGALDAIASCFIGGTSMRGGIGTVNGAMIGAVIMASLDNGMSMMNVDTFWQMIVKGSILILAVWMDVASGSER
ncbi:sugar ABC transporter permease [Telmatospirillum sp.]|uniref:sugar ABC transporter permease n=1 Tax=Telmatospirillum sp. TaxID=2079197 RepID=UPI002840743C|nr:sugar ABC transporter permease [Telmatospirillum sp.]MDR3438037.1 sugar ABC transporter permease [Telmatospirillum sp.]